MTDFSPELYRGLAEFRSAMRRFLAAAEAISKAEGVTQPQYQALLAIKSWPSRAMTMKDLAEQLLLTHHAAVEMVDRLSAAGHVERTPSSTDRRSVHVNLTAAGETVVERLAAQHVREVLRQAPLLTRSLRRVRKMAADFR